MHKYLIVESWVDGKQCVFKCHNARYHVARVLSGMPPPGVTLSGAKPHLGFGLLSAPTGATYRVHFESINETRLPSVSA